MSAASPHRLPETPPLAPFRPLSNALVVEDTDVSFVAGPSPQMDLDKSPERLSLAQEVAFVGVVSLSNLLVQAGAAQGLALARLISGALGGDGSPTEVSWFAASYSLTAAAFLLVAGRLGDMFSYKKMLLGLGWFGLWSFAAACCTFADSAVLFNIARALQGVGPAYVMPNGLALLGLFYAPGKRKNMVFAVYSSTSPIGYCGGAVISAALAQYASWPWMFVAMGVSCWALAALGALAVPTRVIAQTIEDEAARPPFDLLGAVFGVTGLVLVNIAWNQAPAEGWGEPYIGILLALGLLALVAFAYVERRVKEPLLPPDCVNTDTTLVLAILGLGWGSFGVWLLYLWEFLEGLRGLSALHASLQVAMLGLFGATAGVSTGFLLSRVATSRILLISVTSFTMGSLLLATEPVNQTYWGQTFVSMIIMPLAMDMSFPAGTVMLSNSLPKKYQGQGALLVSTVVNYHMSIGLGVAGTAEYYVRLHGSGTLEGYRSGWFVGVAFGALGILMAIWAIHRQHRRSSRLELPA